jgi:3-hydroxyacyl-[acyl-carrier-protein] dehydratase
MLLIDEIVESTDDSIVCRKTFREDEFFVQGHYPEFPLVPGVILIESCCQAGAVLVSRILDKIASSAVPVLTRVDKAKFKKMVRPGDTVELHAEVRETVQNVIFLSGKVMVGDALSLRFDFVCSLAPKAQK